jgi:hypothetical protein
MEDFFSSRNGGFLLLRRLINKNRFLYSNCRWTGVLSAGQVPLQRNPTAINGRLGKATSSKFRDNLDGQYKYGEESRSHEDEALH